MSSKLFGTYEEGVLSLYLSLCLLQFLPLRYEVLMLAMLYKFIEAEMVA
jgi:hypothetical protein